MTVLGKVGGTMVAVGRVQSDHWAVSNDGIAWTVRHDINLSSVFLSGCASDPTQLVCVGWPNGFNVSNAIAFATSDGVTWKDVSPDFAGARIRGAGWKGEELMAVGERGAMSSDTAPSHHRWRPPGDGRRGRAVRTRARLSGCV